jgi:hypothetical protein
MTALHELAELLAPGDAKLIAELDRGEDPWMGVDGAKMAPVYGASLLALPRRKA